MRLRDKILCLILTIILCISSASTFAAESTGEEAVTIYVHSDFEVDTVGRQKPMGFKLINSGESGRTVIVAVDDTKAFQITTNTSVGNGGLVSYMSEPVTGDVIIGTRLRNLDNNPCGKTIGIVTSAKTTYNFIQIVDGELRAGVTRIMGLALNKFYKIEAALHLDKGTMDIYVDGKKRIVNQAMSTGINDFTKIEWSANNGTAKDSSYIIDDVEVYASSVPLPPEKLYSATTATEFAVPEDAVSEEDFRKNASGIVGFYINKPAALVKGEASYINKARTAHPYYEEDTAMLPVRFMAESLGGSVSYNAEKNCVSVSVNGRTAEFVYGQEILTVDGVQKNLLIAPKNSGGVGYVPAKAFCDALGISLLEGKGLLLCSLSPINLSWEKDTAMLNAFCEHFLYDDVSGSEIAALVKEKYAQNQHPRLIFSNEDFKYMREELAKGETGNSDVRAMFEKVRNEADACMNKLPFPYHEMDAEDLFAFGYNTDVRLLSLALMYNLTGDERYAVRCRQELTSVCAYQDWHPLETADTGRMASAVSLAYDWIYDTLSELDHRLIKNAIVTKGISQLINDYDDLTIPGADRKDLLQRIWMWNSPYSVNYWRFAVGGVGVSALAIIDELEGESLAMAERVLEQSLKDARPAMGLFTKTASDAENEKNCRYYSIMTASYISATGRAFGFADAPGVTAEKTGISPDGSYDGIKILNIALAADSDTTQMDVPDGETYEDDITDDEQSDIDDEAADDEYFTEEDLHEEEEQYDEDEQVNEEGSSDEL